MDHLQINNFKAFWDCDNRFGNIELFFSNGQHWRSPNLPADEFTAMLSVLQFPNISWHIPTRSLVKA